MAFVDSILKVFVLHTKRLLKEQAKKGRGRPAKA